MIHQIKQFILRILIHIVRRIFVLMYGFTSIITSFLAFHSDSQIWIITFGCYLSGFFMYLDFTYQDYINKTKEQNDE